MVRVFTTKTIDVFDTNTIKPGYFITYCAIKADWETDEMLEEYQVYRDTEPMNGIISSVNENTMSIIDSDLIEFTMHINEITSPKESDRCYKILGIRENAM